MSCNKQIWYLRKCVDFLSLPIFFTLLHHIEIMIFSHVTVSERNYACVRVYASRFADLMCVCHKHCIHKISHIPCACILCAHDSTLFIDVDGKGSILGKSCLVVWICSNAGAEKSFWNRWKCHPSLRIEPFPQLFESDNLLTTPFWRWWQAELEEYNAINFPNTSMLLQSLGLELSNKY